MYIIKNFELEGVKEIDAQEMKEVCGGGVLIPIAIWFLTSLAYDLISDPGAISRGAARVMSEEI